MRLFGDDVGTPIFKTIEGAQQSSNVLFYGLIVFVLLLVGLAVTMFLLKKKFVKTKHKDYVDLP